MTKSIENFSFSTNIITEVLGRDLTENYSVVFAEQIKNAKDANASRINIDLHNFPESICIKDDGQGMEDIKRAWFTAGTTLKRENQDMLGGKGIGRFTLFALGKTIEVTTAYNGVISKFKLSSDELADSSSAENIKIVVEKIENKTGFIGTEIVITDIIPEVLEVEDIRRDLRNLVLDDSINIQIISNETENTSFIPIKTGINFSTLRSKFSLSWDAKGEAVVKEIITANLLNEKHVLRDHASKSVNDFLGHLRNRTALKELGELSFDVYHFYSPQKNRNDPRAKKPLTPFEIDGTITQKDIRERFLSYAAGINIYRNGFKIFGYGSNDWLGLDSSSRNNSNNISNVQTVGIVNISKNSSGVLRETTNREGLKQDSIAFSVFRSVILLFVGEINGYRSGLGSELTKLSDNYRENISTSAASITKNVPNESKDDEPQGDKKSRDDPSAPKDSERKTERDSQSKEHPKIVLNNKKRECRIHQNIDLTKFVKYGITKEGDRISSSSLKYFVNQTIVLNGEQGALDSPQTLNVIVKTLDGSAVNNFDLKVVNGSISSSRRELFPLKNGRHFKFESDDPNDVLRNLMMQINYLWMDGSFDYVVATAIRPLIEIELRRIRPINDKLPVDKQINPLKPGMSGVESIVSYALEGGNRKKVTKELSYTGNDSDNFLKNFENQKDYKKSGILFKKELDKANLGSHDPATAINPERLYSLALNIKCFLELCEGVKKTLLKK